MGCYEIDHAVNDIVRIFLEEGYTEKTITEHRRNIQRVVNLHYEHETPFYDSKIVEHYIAGLEENYKLGIISRSRKNALIKAALYVHEIATTGTVAAGAKVIPNKLSSHYRMILEKVKDSKEWSEALKRNIISFTMPSTYKISKPVPHDEIAQMFSVIDRNTAIGKRDYAMFTIAVVTGMRSIDITELQFSDIDWVNGEIRITQKKTDIPLALPLTRDIGEALSDYILHGRPRSNFTNVFLTSRPPIQPLGRRCVYDAFNHARKLAGLKNRPFHDLRRAVGTNMVVAGVPVTTVAQVLGHIEISSTKQYISLDSVHLKECSLGLTGIEQTGGTTYD